MIENIVKWMAKANGLDRKIGMTSYENYNLMMKKISHHYDVPFDRVTAAFCALSPNNDYVGNLRSLISVLEDGEKANVTTYNHCKDRALKYINGEDEFDTKKRGSKILSFYRNIIDPQDPNPITIDGHMMAIYEDKENAKMKDFASLSKEKYKKVSSDFILVANAVGILPNQLQATLWYTRKRVLDIVFERNLSLFHDAGKIIFDLSELPPYKRFQ